MKDKRLKEKELCSNYSFVFYPSMILQYVN